MPLNAFTRCFLLAKPSSRALKLARRNWLGSIRCYYPDNLTPSWKDIPFATRLIRQPLQILPGPNIYRVAREYADAVLDEIDSLLPGFFQVGNWDFRFAFRFNLQFHLAYQGLPLLYSTLLEQKPSGSALHLVDNHLSPHLVHQFAKEAGFDTSTCSIRCLSTLHPSRLTRKLSQWRKQARLEEGESVCGGILAVIPHTEHLDLLEPLLSFLAEQGPIRLLPLHAKACLPEGKPAGATVHRLSGLRANQHLEKAIAHFERLRTDAQRLTPGQRQFCYTQIDLLSDLVEKFLVFEATMTRLKPDTVIGCLEFSLHGAFLSMLRARSAAFRLLNVQHGIVGPTWAVDGLCFDDYFLWNRRTAESLRQNGYPPDYRVHVIGNPKWEALAQSVASGIPSESFASLRAWKGNAPLIGAYTQCLQGYSTAGIKRDYLSSLVGYLRHNPEAKLLIKRHPLENDDVVDTVIQGSGCQDRIRVVQSEQLPLWETLKAVDIVVSVFSAALYEGLYLKKPTLALDFERVIATQQVPWPEHLTVTAPHSVNAELDHWLAVKHRGLDTLSPDALTAIIPRFDTPYALRFRHLLETQALPSASSD